MKARVATTIRFTEEDRQIIEELQRLTGLEGPTAVIRLTLRESLAARGKRPKR